MEAPLSPSPVSDSPTPVSDSEDEPMPQAPLADDGWWQSDASWLAPIAASKGDDAQAAPWWHKQYNEENPIGIATVEPEPEAEEDPWTNWSWSFKYNRYDWVDPTGDRRRGNFLADGKTRLPRHRGGKTRKFFMDKYG